MSAPHKEPTTTGYAATGRAGRTLPGPLNSLDLAGGAWPAFLAAGLGSVALGVVLLVWPNATLAVVAILIGVSLLVAGLLRLVSGFTMREASGAARTGSVVIGLLAMIVGLYCIRHYHVTIAVLAIVVGLFWVMHGIAEIAAGLLGGRGTGPGLAVLSGVLSLAAGLLVLFWPTISLTVLVVVMGIWLVVYGLLMAVAAFALRRGGAGAGQDSLASA